jgi:hypothetical protein
MGHRGQQGIRDVFNQLNNWSCTEIKEQVAQSISLTHSRVNLKLWAKVSIKFNAGESMLVEVLNSDYYLIANLHLL